MKMMLAVAAGGAMGAVCRYLVMNGAGHFMGHGFPYGTLIVNIVGSFIMGLVIEYSALNWSPSPEIRAFIVIGVLGAFTTFSTFSLDFVTLYKSQAYLPLMLYTMGSIMLSIAALFSGLWVVKMVVGT